MLYLSEQASNKPKSFLWGPGVLSLLFLLLVALPSLQPETFPFLNPLQIDTDPENMLEADEPVRQLHNAMKTEFGISDIVVVGGINNEYPQGAFNVQSLSNVHALTEFASTLQWQEENNTEGVIAVDIIAPSTVDDDPTLPGRSGVLARVSG